MKHHTTYQHRLHRNSNFTTLFKRMRNKGYLINRCCSMVLSLREESGRWGGEAARRRRRSSPPRRASPPRDHEPLALARVREHVIIILICHRFWTPFKKPNGTGEKIFCLVSVLFQWFSSWDGLNTLPMLSLNDIEF